MFSMTGGQSWTGYPRSGGGGGGGGGRPGGARGREQECAAPHARERKPAWWLEMRRREREEREREERAKERSESRHAAARGPRATPSSVYARPPRRASAAGALVKDGDAKAEPACERKDEHAEHKEKAKQTPKTDKAKHSPEKSPKTEEAKRTGETASKSESTKQAAESTLKTDNTKQSDEPTPKTDNTKHTAEPAPKTDSTKQTAEATSKTDDTKPTAEPTPKTDTTKQTAESTPKTDKSQQSPECGQPDLRSSLTPEGERGAKNCPEPMGPERDEPSPGAREGGSPGERSASQELSLASTAFSDGSSFNISGLELVDTDASPQAQPGDGKDAPLKKRKPARGQGDGAGEGGGGGEGGESGPQEGGGGRGPTGVEAKRARAEAHAWICRSDLLRAATGAFNPAVRDELEIIKMVRIKRKPREREGAGAGARAAGPEEVHTFTHREDADGLTFAHAHARLRSFRPAPPAPQPAPDDADAPPAATHARFFRNPFAQGAFGRPAAPAPAPAPAPAAEAPPAAPGTAGGAASEEPAPAPAAAGTGAEAGAGASHEPKLPPATEDALRLVAERVLAGVHALRRRLGPGYAARPHAPHVEHFIGLEREAEARRQLPHVRDALRRLKAFFRYDEMTFGVLTTEATRRSELPESEVEVEELVFHVYRLALFEDGQSGFRDPPPDADAAAAAAAPAPRRPPWEQSGPSASASAVAPVAAVTAQQLTPSSALVNIHLYTQSSSPKAPGLRPPGPARACARPWRLQQLLQQQQQGAACGCACACGPPAYCPVAQQIAEAADAEFSSFHHLSDLQMSHGQHFAFHGNRRHYLS